MQPGREKASSCLDLALASANLVPFVASLVIDCKREFTPRRIRKRPNGLEAIYTDHYSLELKLDGLAGREGSKEKKVSSWNLSKPGGWETYKRLTEEAAPRVKQAAEDEELDADKTMKIVEGIENKIKFKAFGKSKPPTQKKQAKNLLLSDEELVRKQSMKIEEDITNIKEGKQGRVGQVYNMMKYLTGDKKEGQEPVAIKDPKTNQLVVAPKDIKRVTLKYCVDNLTKKEPAKEHEQVKELRKSIHNKRMEKCEDDDFMIDKDDFEAVLKKFSSKSTRTYDFLLKASEEYKDSIFQLCMKFFEKEEFPEKFRKTILFMIWKRKGGAEVLSNNRFIHLKETYLARTCEALLLSQMKHQVFVKSTVYQIGGQASHSTNEHLFTIKSIMGLMESQGDGFILTLVDIIAFFDREDILEVSETFEKMSVNKKACRLWYKLNDQTEIQIKTAVGMSDSAMVGPLVGQGSGLAAVGSQAMVDYGLYDYFGDSGDEYYYGDVRVETAAFQDDICKPSSNVIMTQLGMTRLGGMLRERGLEAHKDKTGYIVFGNKKYREKTEKELEAMPLTMSGFQVVRKERDKYLGQVLHGGGLAMSVKATIQERAGRIKGAIYKAKQVIETVQMQAIGGMMAAKQLWEGAIVPSLLSGAGTWVGSTQEAEEMCEELQELFWLTMFQISRSGPKVMLTAETVSMRMKQRIWLQKLLTARNILMQEDSLARRIYSQQLARGWPGLAREVCEICKEIGIDDINEKMVEKDVIKEAVFYHNYREMKEDMMKCKKLEEIRHNDFRCLPDYIAKEKSVEKVRLAYRVRTKMVTDIKQNFKNSHKGGLQCDWCDSGEEESQCHVTQCTGWEEKRRGLDLINMMDMVEFFRRILTKKAKKKKEGLLT